MIMSERKITQVWRSHWICLNMKAMQIFAQARLQAQGGWLMKRILCLDCIIRRDIVDVATNSIPCTDKQEGPFQYIKPLMLRSGHNTLSCIPMSLSLLRLPQQSNLSY